jgi:hypothetical protein
MITKLVPIVVAIALCFFFKNTRWVGIVAIAATSYFYPMPFLVTGSLTGVFYGIYRYRLR